MRRVLSEHRCPGCEIRKSLCFCDQIPQLTLQTRVIVLMHTGEEVLPSNTARLAVRALVHSELRIYGRKDERMSTEGLVEPARQSLLLFPSAHAQPLTQPPGPGPFTLIVPDGKWRQSLKLTRREPALAGIPHVKIPPSAPSAYRLRTQPNPESLCTLEAIARALGVLEQPQAQQELERVLQTLVARTLWSRGQLTAAEARAAGIAPKSRH